MDEKKKTPFRIFALEDDVELALLIRINLKREGYHVMTCSDEQEAMALIMADPPDLLLLDYQLPTMNGKDVIELLAKQQLEIPFIIMTGHGDERIAVEMMKLGAMDYVLKDIHFIELLPSVIRKVTKSLNTRKELENVQRSLRESEERFKLALEAATQGIFDWNMQTGKVYFSPYCYIMLGYEPNEIKDSYDSLASLLSPDDKDTVSHIFDEYNETNRISHQITYRLKAKTDEWRFVLSRGKIVEQDSTGKPIRMIGTHVDITERKKAEEERRQLEKQLRQAQKMEAVGQLAGGVAHDFNNMLFVISGYTELMLSELSPESPYYENLNSIMKIIERATTLVRQLLLYSRKEAMQLKPIKINDLITNMTKMIRRLIGEHILLEFIPGFDVMPVFADSSQIEQVLMNLCLNARDAMPEGGRIFIETENVSVDDEFCKKYNLTKPGKYVRLCISDSGHGIPREIQDKIFDPFFSTKEVGKGTGLGLAAVYGIVKSHQGMIRVYSEPGHGAIFKIYLPTATHALKPEESKNDFIRKPITGKETILLAEDERPVREMLVRIFEKHGYRTITADDGDEAIRQFEHYHQAIDLALLDIVMPKIGGPKVLERIKALSPSVPVILMTGYSRGMLNLDISHGNNYEIIQKPFSQYDLLNKVKNMLERTAKIRPTGQRI